MTEHELQRMTTESFALPYWDRTDNRDSVELIFPFELMGDSVTAPDIGVRATRQTSVKIGVN